MLAAFTFTPADLSNLCHLDAPHLWPLFKITPTELAFLDKIQLKEDRFGVVVNHQDKRLSRPQAVESFENQWVPFRMWNFPDIDRGSNFRYGVCV
jgi:hypothetical protein